MSNMSQSDKANEESTTISALRADIYNIFDRVIESGKPIKIVRKGVTVRLVPETTKSKLSRVRKIDCLNCEPEELLGLNWEHEWSGGDLP